MISKIARLRAKKGFTIIELIVVIAIIGILTSIVIASMGYDRKPALGKSMAKDMFYKVQDCLATVRVGFPKAFDSTIDDIDGFYAEIDGNGEIEAWGTFVKDPSDVLPTFTTAPTLTDIDHSGTAGADRNALLVRIHEALTKYLSQTDNMTGTLYVIIDGFKVKSAYWSDCSFSAVAGTTGLVANDNILDNGYYYCAYPIYKSFAGEQAFSDVA